MARQRTISSKQSNGANLDVLLRKLISGEIRIQQLEKIVECHA